MFDPRSLHFSASQKAHLFSVSIISSIKVKYATFDAVKAIRFLKIKHREKISSANVVLGKFVSSFIASLSIILLHFLRS